MARPKRINKNQLNSLYWPEFRKAERVLIAAGFSKAEAEEQRKDIHKAVTGTACSSKDLTNPELDRVLREFLKISAPNNGTRQADLADGQCKRYRHVIKGLATKIGVDDAYVAGIASRMRYPTDLEQCDERQLRNILTALDEHAKRQ